jgi:hypothetical protein
MTRFDFLLKTFATHTEQIRAMLDDQQTIVDMLNEPREAERFKRPWVGLTDEEILDIVGRAGVGCPAVGLVVVPPYTRDLFKKIEDKLKEKNT